VFALRRTWRTGIIDRYLNLPPRNKSRKTSI
jgi:hypothetical protein